MATRRQLQQALRTKQLQKLPDEFIGIIGDRGGNYNAGGNNVYVRELASGQTVIVKNLTVPNIPGRLVRVQKQGGTLYVIGYWGIYGVRDDQEVFVPDHDHRFPSSNFTPIEAAQIMAFNVWPYDGFTVQIFGGIFPKVDGTYGLLSNQVFDLTSYVPTAGALWVHFQYDIDGVVTVVEGDLVDVPQQLNASNIPVATETSMRVAVRLYDGQEYIRRDGIIDDFADWRFGQPRYMASQIGAIPGGVRVGEDVQEQLDELDTAKMSKSVYDIDDDGIVDEAENSLAVDGILVDNTSSPPMDGQVLVYDAYTDKYAPEDMSGGGDMLKTVYDVDDDGVVDEAENAQAIDGIQVDNTSTPPIDGQVLVYDEYLDCYIPDDTEGVTNGDSHDHEGGDGAQIDHGSLAGLGDDDHTQYIKHSLATAADDFLVASGVGAFVKKTLAETITILRVALDAVYSAIGHTHDYDYTDISGNDADTDVTGLELEELTDGSETTLHSHVVTSQLTNRILDDDLTIPDGHCLIVYGYLDLNGYDLTLEGDADLYFLGGIHNQHFDDSYLPAEVDAGAGDYGDSLFSARRDHKHHSSLLSLLPWGMYLDVQPFTSGTKLPYLAPIVYNLTLAGAFYIFAKVSTTNNGSNYWRIRIKMADGTTISEADTSAISAGTWEALMDFVDDTVVTPTDKFLYVECSIAAGTPGALNLSVPVLDAALTT